MVNAKAMYGRLKRKKDFKLLAYEKWLHTRSSKYNDLT